MMFRTRNLNLLSPSNGEQPSRNVRISITGVSSEHAEGEMDMSNGYVWRSYFVCVDIGTRTRKCPEGTSFAIGSGALL